MSETWKQIDGFDNYEVSDHGRVRHKTTNNLLLKKHGYFCFRYSFWLWVSFHTCPFYKFFLLLYKTFLCLLWPERNCIGQNPMSS